MTLIIVAICLAFIYDFLNGMNDAANSIATIVSTRVLSPRWAVAWAALFNFLSYFIFGITVAETIGTGLIRTEFINEESILASLVGAGIWVLICTISGIPISVSHALVGGLIGPVVYVYGTDALISNGIAWLLAFIVIAPLIGFILGYLIMIIVMWTARNRSPASVDRQFKVLQLASSAAFSLGHGSNDAQKTMGVVAVLLFTTGHLGEKFYVPNWVVLTSYIVIALGTLTGGWKVIKTMGIGITRLKPAGGFSAEVAGAMTIIMSSTMGIPVSTTHTITGAIAGVGVTHRISEVKWSVAYKIFWAWILTIPMAALMAALFYKIFLFD